MKKLIVLMIIFLLGCTKADRVNYNIRMDADNFLVRRKVIALNTRTNEALFEVEGLISIVSDSDGDLNVTIKTGEDEYKLNQTTLHHTHTRSASFHRKRLLNMALLTLSLRRESDMKSITELRQQREELQKAIGAYMHELSNWDAHIEKVRQEGYQKGLDDAWELARRIKNHPERGGMSLDELLECFGNVAEISVFKVPVSEAKAKYDAWKSKKEQNDEIRVGDVVKLDGCEYIVIKVSAGFYGVINPTNNCGGMISKEAAKTGKHYDLPWLNSQI